MPTFQNAYSEDHNDDRAYVPMDDAFDISTLKVETGIAIDRNVLALDRED